MAIYIDYCERYSALFEPDFYVFKMSHGAKKIGERSAVLAHWSTKFLGKTGDSADLSLNRLESGFFVEFFDVVIDTDFGGESREIYL